MQDPSNFQDPIMAEIESVGGEPLGGSGLETEEPEPDFDNGKGAEV